MKVLYCVFLAEFDTVNPLDMLVMDGSNEVSMIFGTEFIDKVRRIRYVCEWKDYIAETDLQHERQELLRYRNNMDKLTKEKYFKDLPLDEQNKIQNSFQKAYDDLLQEETDREDQLARECNNALVKLEAEKMEDALNFVLAKLAKGIGAFVTFVNQVDDYGMVVESALAQCLDTYANELLSRYYMVKMSPSEVCMQVEVEILVRFIKEFVVRASQLVTSYSDDEDFTSLVSGSGSFERPPPRLPESLPRPYSNINQPLQGSDSQESDSQGSDSHEPDSQESDSKEETDTAEPGTVDEVDRENNDPFDSDFSDPDQNHEPAPSPVSHEYTGEENSQELSSSITPNQVEDQPRPTQHSPCKSSVPTPWPSPVVDDASERSGSKG